jgi:hypothetical protein
MTGSTEQGKETHFGFTATGAAVGEVGLVIEVETQVMKNQCSSDDVFQTLLPSAPVHLQLTFGDSKPVGQITKHIFDTLSSS